MWDEINLGVKYGSDYKLAREIMQRVGEEICGEFARSAASTWTTLVHKYRLENASVAPTVTVIANENWMRFTLRYAVDYKLRRNTKDKLFTRLIEEIDKTDNRVRVAASSIEISTLPELNLHWRGNPPPGQ